MTRSSWFDEIGLTYAKNFDEVEAARSAYTQQRQAVLDALDRVFESAFDGTTFGPIERGKAENGWETFWLTGQFTKARIKADTGPRQSAVVFGLGTDPCFENVGGGCYGFGAYVLFKMNPKRFQQLRLTMATLNVSFEYFAEDSGAYLRSVWIKPGDERFQLSAFEEEIAKLPELFAKADEAIGAAYYKLKFG